jgi:hypothetical protein
LGAKGSSNDLVFNTEEENIRYEKMSEELYDAMVMGLIAGINSY